MEYINLSLCGQTDTAVLSLVISSESEGGHIHLNVLKAFDLHMLRLTQKHVLFEQNYFTGNMPLPIPGHSFETCGGPKVLTSTTIFKKCGVRTSSGRKTGALCPEKHLELLYQINNKSSKKE